MSVAKAKHAGTHVVAHVVIPWLLKGAVAVGATVAGSVGLDIGPVAHALHVDSAVEHVAAPIACAAPITHP
jgi:hypothetical protein